MLHTYATLAEKERRLISARTKAAKARGQRLGRNGAEQLALAYRAEAIERAKAPAPVVAEIQAAGASLHLQQGIESDYFRVKTNMPRIGGFQSFGTARRTISGFEAMLWLRKGFGFAGAWTVCEQNRLLALCFGLPEVNKV